MDSLDIATEAILSNSKFLYLLFSPMLVVCGIYFCETDLSTNKSIDIPADSLRAVLRNSLNWLGSFLCIVLVFYGIDYLRVPLPDWVTSTNFSNTSTRAKHLVGYWFIIQLIKFRAPLMIVIYSLGLRSFLSAALKKK